MRAARSTCILAGFFACVCGTSAGAQVDTLTGTQAEKRAATTLQNLGAKLRYAGGAVVGVEYHAVALDERTLELLEQLPRLESLALTRTTVPDDAMRRLAGLTTLRHLDLMGSNVGDAGIAHLTALRDLQTLRLAATPLTNADMVHLQMFHGLQTLDLTGTRISGDPLKHIAHLDRLESLTLMGTGVGDEGMRHLAGLTRLRHLDLTDTDVGDAGVAHLAPLKNLQTLRLAGTLVTDASMEHVRTFKRLQALDLYQTGVTSRGVGRLDTLGELREFDLCSGEGDWGPGIRESGLYELERRKALPKLEKVNFRPLGDLLPLLTNSPRLQALHLENVYFMNRREFKALGTFKELQLLDLSNATMLFEPREDAWADLAGLERLESLSLNHLRLTDRELTHVARLEGLRHLLLGGTGITGNQLKLLAPLGQLRSLHLWFNGLKAKDLANLPGLDDLEELYLGENQLGRGTLKSLPKLESLRVLDLSSARFRARELRDLSKFPKLEVLCLLDAYLGDKDFVDLPALPKLRILVVSHGALQPETIRAFRGRRVMVRRDPRWPPSTGPFRPFGWRRLEVFDRILVQALIPTSPKPDTRDIRGTITQVYLGPETFRGMPLQGQPFLVWFGLGQRTSLGTGRLASHELAILDLERRPDEWHEWHWDPSSAGEMLTTRHSPFPTAPPIGAAGRDVVGQEEYDHHERRDGAEFLRTAAQKSGPERVVFLEEQVIRGSDVEAATAAWLLLLDPIDTSAEPHLLRVLQDQRVPLSRRILIDRAFWQRPDRPWTYSPERIVLLRKWVDELKSAEEAEDLGRDLCSFGYTLPDFWASHPEPKKRVLGLIGVVEALQDSPKASVGAKSDAVLAFNAQWAVAARSECFEALARLAKHSPHHDVRFWAASQLSCFAPFAPSEAAQVRELLKGTMDETSRQQLEEALAAPTKP